MGNDTVIGTRVSDSTLEAIDQMAAGVGKSRSAILSQAIELYFGLESAELYRRSSRRHFGDRLQIVFERLMDALEAMEKLTDTSNVIGDSAGDDMAALALIWSKDAPNPKVDKTYRDVILYFSHRIASTASKMDEDLRAALDAEIQKRENQKCTAPSTKPTSKAPRGKRRASK